MTRSENDSDDRDDARAAHVVTDPGGFAPADGSRRDDSVKAVGAPAIQPTDSSAHQNDSFDDAMEQLARRTRHIPESLEAGSAYHAEPHFPPAGNDTLESQAGVIVAIPTERVARRAAPEAEPVALPGVGRTKWMVAAAGIFALVLGIGLATWKSSGTSDPAPTAAPPSQIEIVSTPTPIPSPIAEVKPTASAPASVAVPTETARTPVAPAPTQSAAPTRAPTAVREPAPRVLPVNPPPGAPPATALPKEL